MQNLAQISADVVDQIARELVRVERIGSGWIVSTPIYYPSGSGAAVNVQQVRDRFFVTDMGLGFREAEFSGASAQYRNEARRISEASGVRFDDHAFFEAEVSRSQLPGAVAAVANCSSKAAELAIYKLSQRKEKDAVDVLFRRLSAIFTPKRVDRDVEILGASTTPWRVATVVKDGGRPTIFEPVSKYPASIYSTATKFHDIARLEIPPKCIAVVRSKDELNTYLGVLAQAGNVIEAAANDSTYESLAEAA